MVRWIKVCDFELEIFFCLLFDVLSVVHTCPLYRAIVRVAPIGINFMSRATALGAPLNRECHPEQSEGSLSPASQTLRCAQGDKRRQTARVGRPGKSAPVNAYEGRPYISTVIFYPSQSSVPEAGIHDLNKSILSGEEMRL